MTRRTRSRTTRKGSVSAPKRTPSDDGLAALHRELGYRGQPAKGAKVSALAASRAGKRALGAAARELPPLDYAAVRKLEKEFLKNPDGVMSIVRKSLRSLSETDFRQALAEAKVATANPMPYAKILAARRKTLDALCGRPEEVPEIPGIEVNPCRHRYETVGDALGWVVQCGRYWLLQKLGKLETAELPRHTNADQFRYKMKSPAGADCRPEDTITVALFSDFGTGEYQSLYVAKAMAARRPDYAIHLGDVYYAGRDAELKDFLEAPLEPLCRTSRVFTMNANHEMLSGGFAYLEFLTRKKAGQPGWVEQEQEASYFSLESPRYQVIAIDTAQDYRNDGRYIDSELKKWLSERLREGKATNPPKTTVLLSQHEPFGLGVEQPTDLLDDIRRCAFEGDRWLIDYWFWGDEHYCALYEPNAAAPFIGSCIGHAGYPVDWNSVDRAKRKGEAGGAFAKARWVDDSRRFSKVRSDLGNAGFCLLRLKPDGVQLEYVDWLGRKLAVP